MLLSSNRAGEKLGLKQEVVAALVRAGIIKGDRHGIHYVIQDSEVERFAKANGVKTKSI